MPMTPFSGVHRRQKLRLQSGRGERFLARRFELARELLLLDEPALGARQCLERR
jgi:hypothetical protein